VNPAAWGCTPAGDRYYLERRRLENLVCSQVHLDAHLDWEDAGAVGGDDISAGLMEQGDRRPGLSADNGDRRCGL